MLGVLIFICDYFVSLCFYAMPKAKRKSNLRHCKSCTDKSRKSLFVFGDFQIRVMKWDCRKQNVVYIVKCKLCEKHFGKFTFYVGETYMKYSERMNGHRKDPSDAIRRHFSQIHGCKMWKNVELFIVDQIDDQLVREGREQWIRSQLREAGRTMVPQITELLLNTYSL